MMTRILLSILLLGGPVLGATLTIGTATAAAQASAAVNVTFTSQGDSVTDLNFDIGYDSAAMSVNVTAGQLVTAAGKTLASSDPASGKKRVLITGLNSNALGDGTLVTLTVNLRAAAPGSLSVKFASGSVKATDKNGKDVRVTTSDGAVTVTGGARPAVTHNATFLPEISAGAWVAIKSSNLASVTRTWGSADFVGDNLPNALDGVSVTIDGKPAYVQYISPSQVIVLAPWSDTSDKQVVVQVTSPLGRFEGVTVPRKKHSPGFLTFGANYAVATHSDNSVVARADLYPGAGLRPAAPGETITLWGTGFGPVENMPPDGKVFSGAYRTIDPVVVRIGSAEAQVAFAGLVGPGLNQINVAVPNLPAGDHSITAEVGGQRSPASVQLSVAP